MILRVSALIATGRAALECNGEIVAWGSLEQMAAAYEAGCVLVISPDTDEALRAALAKDVTPRALATGAGL